VFKDMGNCGVDPNKATKVNDLIVCICGRDIDTGNWLHQRVCKVGDNPFMITSNRNVILATFHS